MVDSLGLWLKSWTLVVPLIAVVLLGGVWGRRPTAAAGGGADRRAGGDGAGCGPPRRGGRPSGGGAVWVAGIGGGSDGDRGRVDRHAHGVRRSEDGVAGPRYGVRRGDDHDERRRRPVPAGGLGTVRVSGVQPGGHRGALATVTILAVLSLVLPTFTTSHPGPEFSPGQLAFAAVASLLLYALFVVTQTVRHRDFFLPAGAGPGGAAGEGRAPPPSRRPASGSLRLLWV